MGEDTGTKGFFENSGNTFGWLNTAEAASYFADDSECAANRGAPGTYSST